MCLLAIEEARLSLVVDAQAKRNLTVAFVDGRAHGSNGGSSFLVCQWFDEAVVQSFGYDWPTTGG